MGRKKREKIKKKRQAGVKTKTLAESTASAPSQPDQTGAADLSHLSGDWREFYRLVIDRVNSA